MHTDMQHTEAVYLGGNPYMVETYLQTVVVVKSGKKGQCMAKRASVHHFLVSQSDSMLLLFSRH